MALVIPLIIVLAYFMTSGMAVLQRPVSGGFVNWLIKQVAKAPIFGPVSVEQIVKLDRYITHQLGRAFNAVYKQGTGWLAAFAHYQYVVGYWSLYWPIALVHEVRHLNSHTIPRAVTAKTKPLERRVDVAEAEAKAAAAKAHGVTKYVVANPNTKVIKRVERVAMPHAKEWDWLHKHWKAVTAVVLGAAALPGTIALDHPATLPVPFGRTVKQLRRRLGKVEALLGVTGLAIALAHVFRLNGNWRCLTRGNIGRFMRGLCRAPNWLLDIFLLEAFTAFTILDLCDFIKAEVKLAEWLQPLLMDFVDVDEWLIQNCKYDKAPDLTLPPLSLPSGSYGVTLNGERDFALGLAG